MEKWLYKTKAEKIELGRYWTVKDPLIFFDENNEIVEEVI